MKGEGACLLKLVWEVRTADEGIVCVWEGGLESVRRGRIIGIRRPLYPNGIRLSCRFIFEVSPNVVPFCVNCVFMLCGVCLYIS